MAVVNLRGSRVMTGLAAVPMTIAPAGAAGGIVRVWTETVEVGAADSDTSTYEFARLPSNARILGRSFLSIDDLASAGAPTLDLGCYPVRTGDFTADVDALNNGATLATAGNYDVLGERANYGKMLWEFINGVTVDPKCEVLIKGVMDDADVNVGGTMTIEIYYTLD
jgi:hypothetical protein